MKILAVDDDEIGLSILSATLNSVGYTDLISASSGAEALEKIASSLQHFECFFLDIQMPDMDGIELCSKIRQIDAYKSSPILMITRKTERQYIDDAFDAGANDYINKPFDSLELTVRAKIAEKLVLEKQASARKDHVVSSIKAEMEDMLRFTAQETININSEPNMVEKLALENYLLQLPRGKAFHTKTAAFAIKDFESIFTRSTPSIMHNMLKNIANAITRNINAADYMLAYCGSGIFVSVITSSKDNYPGNLERTIQTSIDGMEFTFDNGIACDVKLLMGLPPKKTSLWSSSLTLNPMNSAMESADKKRRVAPVKQLCSPSHDLFEHNALKAG